MAGLYAPLPTLRRRPRGRLRTDRGRRGLLLLHRSGLSPHTPCQSPGALTRVTARRIAQPPKVTFVTRLRSRQLPSETARQLPDLSTIIRVEPSSTDDSRLQGALPIPDIASSVPTYRECANCESLCKRASDEFQIRVWSFTFGLFRIGMCPRGSGLSCG